MHAATAASLTLPLPARQLKQATLASGENTPPIDSDGTFHLFCNCFLCSSPQQDAGAIQRWCRVRSSSRTSRSSPSTGVRHFSRSKRCQKEHVLCRCRRQCRCRRR